MPESPRWLLKRGRVAEAERSIARVRGVKVEDQVDHVVSWHHVNSGPHDVILLTCCQIRFVISARCKRSSSMSKLSVPRDGLTASDLDVRRCTARFWA